MPALTALENVELPLAEAGVERTERRRRAVELLEYVGLEERGRHRPAQLSGGEQQRVAIARALANRPSLLLADEPTGELDARTGAEIIALLSRLNRDGTTLVVVTHDEELAAAARRVVHMRDGLIVDDGARDAAHAGRGSDATTGAWRHDRAVAAADAGRLALRGARVRRSAVAAGARRGGARRDARDVEAGAPDGGAVDGHRADVPASDPHTTAGGCRAHASYSSGAASEVELRPDDSRVHDAAPRATYRWFDYGAWADVWEAPYGEDVVRFEMPRAGEVAPWESGS